MMRNLKPTLALLLVTLGILGCDNGNRKQPSGVDNSVIGEWWCNMDGFDTTLSFRDGKVVVRMSGNGDSGSFDGAYEFDQRSRVFSATTIGFSGRLDEQGRLLVKIKPVSPNPELAKAVYVFTRTRR